MPKIYLSPSFQDHNVGVGDFGTEEMRCNQIADVVERELRKNSKFEVIRNNPEMSLNEVITDSNRNNPDVHFSIHTNAGANTARGCEVYAYKQGTEGDKLAQIVYRRLSAITPSNDRGVKYNSLAETSQTKAIAVLTEVAFHSNEEDSNWIINNIELIGTELAKSLYEYYGIDYNESVEPSQEYSYEDFVGELQSCIGAKVDKIAGPETLSKTPTLSKKMNRHHSAVIPLQKYLQSLGYDFSKYGIDGDFYNETEKAVKQYQADNKLPVVDGILTAKANTWRSLLRL